MSAVLNRFLTIACAALLAQTAWAHDGEDHGAAAPSPAAMTSTSAAPRLSAQTDQFELVGVLQGTVLTLYLDQFGTNMPVPQAQIELESGAWKGTATEVSPAVYTVAAEPLAQPGNHPLTITVQTTDASDLMDATLEVGPIAPTHAGASQTRFLGVGWMWWGAAALFLALGGLVMVRRLTRQRKQTLTAL